MYIYTKQNYAFVSLQRVVKLHKANINTYQYVMKTQFVIKYKTTLPVSIHEHRICIICKSTVISMTIIKCKKKKITRGS